jgi:hypothetical protein
MAKQKNVVSTPAGGFPIAGSVQTISGRLLVEDLFPGAHNEGVRQQLIEHGRITSGGKELVVRTQRQESGGHRIMALAAVSRDPGLTQPYLDQVQDWLPGERGSRIQQINQLWKIYQNVGIVSNAVNKIAAILSAGGRYKVRYTKKGKKQKPVDELQAVLDEFRRKVNNSSLDSVVKGDRGLQMVTHQATRSALVEGDWFGRTVWIDHQVGSLGTYSMPMIIDSIPSAQIDVDKNLNGLSSVERFFWTPPQNIVNQLRRPTDKDVKDLLNRMFPKDVQKQLLKDGKVLLDPSLLIHVRHRGVAWQIYGESFVQPAKKALLFQQSVENLDLVTMQSLIGRLTIVMVGSSDPKSPYANADVALARTSLMQSFFDQSGPNMTIIWEGDDVKVTTVANHEEMHDLTARHELAQNMVKMALGVPDALLSGTSSDSKSAGWAAVIGASAELEELQKDFAGVWETIGERIALDNGFVDVDLTYEFDRTMLVDKSEERNQNRLDYTTGGMSIYDYLLGMGKDPEAMFERKCMERGLDPDTTTWEDAFMPPQGLQGQGAAGGGAPAAPPGQGGGKPPGTGRTPDNVQGKPAVKPKPKNTVKTHK